GRPHGHDRQPARHWAVDAGPDPVECGRGAPGQQLWCPIRASTAGPPQTAAGHHRGGNPRSAVRPMVGHAQYPGVMVLNQDPRPGEFATSVVGWQRDYGRHSLPWQGTRDPYRIWLSEIMLQQTQVATVIGYYERFLTRFPDIRSLARAD